MLGQLNIYGMDKLELAIERLKAYEPPDGYFVAFSGGKDSVVIKALADMAGVEVEIQTDSYEAKDGSKRYTWEVLAYRVEFLEKKDAAPADQAEQARQNINNVLGINATFESIGNDDIPF